MSSDSRPAGGPRKVAALAKASFLAAVYVLLARFGLRIHAINDFATLIWPPSGIALAALLLLGNRFWPSIAVGAFIANVWTGAPFAVALGIAAGNTLEALAGASALRRIPGFRRNLERLPDVLGLIFLAAVASTVISATIGVTSLLLGGIVAPARFFVTWRAWWLGDAIGDLIVASLLLTWARAAGDRPRRPRLAESGALGALLVLVSFFIFEKGLGMAWLLSPLLVWAALRFEQRGAARATFLVSAVAVWATVRGHGPFVAETIEEGLFVLQAFMAVTSVTFLVLGAVTAERRRLEEERRRAEKAIRQSEERYRTLTEAVDELMWIDDAAGKATFVNRQWQERVGGDGDLSGGIQWAELLHPEDRETLLETRGRAIPAGEPYQAEFRLRTKDGLYRWMLARVVPVTAEGSVTSWLGFAADIHGLKTAEAEMFRAKEAAEAADRAKDDFLAALSHELRTPLTPVLAFSSVLEKNAGLSPEARHQIQIVRRNAELEARLIDDLLDLTRIAKGKLQIQTERVDLSEVLDHVVEICREEAEAKGLLLDRDGGTASTLVRGDSARLHQVFWNIVKNAIKFTPRGGRIQLRTVAPRPGRIAVDVIDTGVGIEPSEIARIFHPFEQVGHRTGGLGLGLTISRSFVQAHDGELTAASEGVGRGATFRVELASLTEADPAPSGSRLASLGTRAAGSRRVLLVEDHADSLTATRDLLAELSCEVFTAGTVAEAITAAAARPFDLVLSDLGLPDGDGRDLMRTLRERHGLAGIAVTGYGMEEDLRRSREAGFVEHLVKPITFQRLATAIERFFAERNDRPGDWTMTTPS